MTQNDNTPPTAIPVIPCATTVDPPTERRLFLGTRILVLVYFVLALAAWVLAVPTADAEMIGRRAAPLLLTLLLLGVAMIAWRVFGRSNLAYNLTMIFGVMFLLCGGVGTYINQRQQARRQSVAIQADAAKLREAAVNAIERGEDPDRNLALEYASLLDQVAAGAPGDEALFAKAVSSALADITELVKARDAASARLSDAGAFDGRSFATIEDADRRLALLDALIQSAEAVRTYDYIKEVRQSLEDSGVSKERAHSLTQGLASDPNVLGQKRACQLECDAYVKYREALALLRDNIGEWSVNESTRAFTFRDPDLVEEYNRLVRAAQELDRQRDVLIRKLVAGAR